MVAAVPPELIQYPRIRVSSPKSASKLRAFGLPGRNFAIERVMSMTLELTPSQAPASGDDVAVVVSSMDPATARPMNAEPPRR